MNFRRFPRIPTKFWHGVAIFCFSVLAVVMSDVGAIAQEQGVENFEMPTIDLSLDEESDSAGMVPEGLEVSFDPMAEGERAVVGADNRAVMTSAKYPWSAIGRLERLNSKGKVVSWCTGTLIGQKTILTNAHCVVNKKTHRLRRARYVFRPNLIRGESTDRANAKVVDYGKRWSRGEQDEDWAVMELDEPLGAYYGQLGWSNFKLKSRRVRNALRKRIFLAGYSRDFPDNVPGHRPGKTPGIHRNCSITGIRKDGRIMHNCDTNPGASGSALIARLRSGKVVIVGIHNGWIRDKDGKPSTNVGTQVNRWAKAARAHQ